MSNVKALVGAFNQEKALEGAFSVIVKSLRYLQEPSFEALRSPGLGGRVKSTTNICLSDCSKSCYTSASVSIV